MTTQTDRATRLRQTLSRDGATCVWCGMSFDGLTRATTDHLVPRVKGGPSWVQNELAACRRCNAERGHRTPAAWLDECRGRGWEPDVDRVVRALESLRAEIARRGGQRRARPYLAHELRRLRRSVA